VECLRNLAARRRTTVLLSIHQPRAAIFANLDRLMILYRGGVAYHGLTKVMKE
jgi:ABC-type multidrug transport system ATPase subunit